MDFEQSLHDGNFADCLAQVEERIRNDPAKSEHRIFLFQLLSVLGDWDRALTQLNVLGDMDAATLAMVQTYKEVLRCEVLRSQVFAGKRSPVAFGKPQQWVALLIDALRLTVDGKHAQAEEIRGQAFEAAPTSSGIVMVRSAEAEEGVEPDQQRFEWIADADCRLGPMIEAVVNGRYYWIPFQHIKTIQVEMPADLRDMVWSPVNFTWTNGGESVGLIPTRYSGSEAHEDHLIRMARKTDWIQHSESSWQGLGQRMLATDVGEFALLDLSRIDLDSSESEGKVEGENLDG